MSYYTKITKAGLAAITAAMNNNSKVPITYMAFGDGNGYIPEPDENATSLVNEVYRVGVNKVEVHNKNPNWLVCEAIIPSAVGGFNIREVALYDSTGNTMLAIANYPPTYKPTIEEGAAKIQTIRIVIQVDNSGNFELIVDPDVVLATIDYVNKQNKNFKFESVNDLVADEKYKDGDFAIVGGSQGGPFIYQSSKTSINDGIFVYNGWTRFTVETGIRPEWAGAPRDGISDDAAAIRKILRYLNDTHPSGGRVFIPRGKELILSSVDASSNCAINIYQSNIHFDFESGGTSLKVMSPMTSAFCFTELVRKVKFEGGTINCNKLADYGFYTNPTVWTPQLDMEWTTVNSPKVAGYLLRTYVCDLEGITTNGGEKGIIIAPVSGSITTSINLRSCYMLNQTQCGYDISIACYSNLISCACDNITAKGGVAYRINSRGGSMIGCGAENVYKLIELSSARGFSINSFYAQRVGSKNSSDPTPYLIEFLTGTNVNISGLYTEIMGGNYYNYKLGITSSNYGSEIVNILDGSINRSEVYWVPNFTYERPVRFMINDATKKDQVINVTLENLQKHIVSLSNLEINHNYTIQLPDGSQPGLTAIQTLDSLKGTGKLIIQGNSSNRELVKLHGAFNRLVIKDCNLNIEFKDLTIENRVGSSDSILLQVDNAGVNLNNVKLDGCNRQTSSYIKAINNSKVKLLGDTVALNHSSLVHDVFTTDDSSEITISPKSEPPISGFWKPGMKIKNINPSTHIGWIYTSSGWKTYGAITA